MFNFIKCSYPESLYFQCHPHTLTKETCLEIDEQSDHVQRYPIPPTSGCRPPRDNSLSLVYGWLCSNLITGSNLSDWVFFSVCSSFNSGGKRRGWGGGTIEIEHVRPLENTETFIRLRFVNKQWTH